MTWRERRSGEKAQGLAVRVGQLVLWGVLPCGVPHDVKGAENVPEEGRCCCAATTWPSGTRWLLGLTQKRQVFYMAKEELFRNKFLGALFRKLGAFPVNRGTGGEGRPGERLRAAGGKRRGGGVHRGGTALRRESF